MKAKYKCSECKYFEIKTDKIRGIHDRCNHYTHGSTYPVNIENEDACKNFEYKQ